MAKIKKEKPEEIVTDVAAETTAAEVMDAVQEEVKEEVAVAEVSSVTEKEIEPPVMENLWVTETDFLLRILEIQETGGWGYHLHGIIKERINFINR